MSASVARIGRTYRRVRFSGARQAHSTLIVLSRRLFRKLSLGEADSDAEPPELSETVKGHQRRKRGKKRPEDQVSPEGLRFGPDVPVETIPIENPELEGLNKDKDYEVIGERVTPKLAQRSPYVILRFVREVVKLLPEKKIRCPLCSRTGTGP